jgi:hypothetical protein
VNFNPEMTTGTAVFLSLLAAFIWGTWFISLKYLGDYPLDGFYLTLFTTSIVLVWSVAYLIDGPTLFTNMRETYATDPSRITVTLLCGVLYVIGIRISLIVLQKIGLSLSQPIQASINVLAGTTLSGLVGGIPAGVSRLWLAVAVLLLIGAVIASMIAGNLRSQMKAAVAQEGNSLQFTQRDLWQGLGLLVISSTFLQAYTFAISYGLHTVSQTNGLAFLPFMALLVAGAFAGSLLTSGVILTLHKQWGRMVHAPFSIQRWGILSGLFHYGGNLIHTAATIQLSSVISWPLGVTMGLWTQAWGLIYGEFKGAPKRVYVSLFTGIGLYLLGAYVVASQVH